MIFKILDKIRAKPKQVRDQYAFGIAAAFTAVLVGVWSLSLPSRFSDMTGAVAGKDTDAAPFSGLITQIKDQFGSAKESVATVFEAASSTIPTPSFLKTDSPADQINQKPIEIRVASSSTSVSADSQFKPVQISTTTAAKTTAQ